MHHKKQINTKKEKKMGNARIHGGGILPRIISFIIFFICLRMNNSSAAKLVSVENVCTSEECSRTATQILENMDPSVSPCDNFYQFVCGKYDKMLNAPYIKDDLAIIDGMKKAIPSMIESYLENNSHEEKNKPFLQAFKLYALCTDQDAMNRQGVTYLRQIIDKIGGWPLIEGEHWRSKNWENVAGKLSELGYKSGIFFDVEMIQVDLPTVKRAIELGPADVSKFERKLLYKLMNVAKKLGFDASSNDQSVFGDLLSVSNRFHHLSTYEDMPDFLTIGQMMVRWPSINWMTYFTGVFSSSPSITIDINELVVMAPDFIDKIVKSTDETPKSAIMNYVIAKVIEDSIPYLNPDITMESNMDSYVKTEHSSAARRKYCAELTTHQLPSIIEAIFAVNHVDDYLNNEVIDLGGKLRNKLDDLMKQADWLDNDTKTNCTEKLSNVHFQIGYQDALKNNYYTEDYIDLKLDENSFLLSMLSINRLKTNMKYKATSQKQLFKANEKIKNPMTAINCRYQPSSNTIDIMPSMLQDPLTNYKLPKYVTYSGIGSIIGDELMRGHKNAAKIFHNNRHSNHSTDNSAFNNKVKCIAAQYHDYLTEKFGLQMDGHQYAKENVGDNVGVTLAHMIYKDWVKQNGPESTLPNFNYTSMQTFWISHVKNKCIKHNPNQLIRFLKEGVHEFRTNVPLVNYPEFAEAFNCPLDSPMNPINKCIIW